MHPSGCAGAPLHWGPTADHARMHHALATCLSMRPALLPPRRSELWTHFTHPGTLRGLLRATVQWICGNGWTFTWPAHAGEAVADAPSIPAAAAAAEATSERIDNWHVGEKDLAFFRYHGLEQGPLEGASEWALMMQRDIPGLVQYTSWRRTLPNGKTEYRSVTISPNATAREFSDMYLDDAYRRNWVSCMELLRNALLLVPPHLLQAVLYVSCAQNLLEAL